MDDLFNKAGREYPLSNKSADWNAVFDKLHPDASAAHTPRSKKNYKRYSWLLLLLLTPFVCVYFNPDKKPSGSNAVIQEKKSNENDSSFSENKSPEKDINTEKELMGGNSSRKLKANKNLNDSRGPIKESDVRIINEPAKKKERRAITASANRRQPADDKQKQPTHRSNPFDYKEENDDLFINKYPLMGLIAYEKPSIGLPPLHSVNGSDSETPAPEKSKKKIISKFYAGLVLGPDLSTIKYQRIRNIGYSVGVLAGYRLNKRWSVEAGALWSKKKYYTDGKYFDKSGTNIPSSVTIDHLDGGCEMFEFPLALRYNFEIGKRSFFGTAGLTSYLMKKENYEYMAYSGGSAYESYRSYKNSGNHLFSNMQLSFGYEHALGSRSIIRIEPYIKIPIKEIGIGNMPVTSTGIYFSLMRNIR